jgi:tetratricopeptide (TPR) repeat protein
MAFGFKNGHLNTRRGFIVIFIFLLASLTGNSPIPPKWELLLASAEELSAQNQHANAKEKYAEALEEAERLGREEPPAAIVLDHIAFHHQQLGQLRDAMQKYERAFEIFVRKAPESRSLVDVVIGLSTVYLESGEISRAQSLLKRFLSRDVAYSPPDKAMLLANLGSALTAQGDLQQGELRFDEVLAILEEDGKERQLVVKTLNNLASIACVTGRVSNALEYSKRARALIGAIENPSPALVIKTLSNAASIAVVEQKWEESRRLYAQALTLCEKTFGPDHYLLGSILQGYSRSLRHLNCRAEAKRAEKRAEVILDRFRHENSLGLTIDARALLGYRAHDGGLSLQ